MIVISDHMDPDVDFYVPPGADATEAFQEAFELSKIYGVAHLVIRGRLYIYAQHRRAPLLLSQSLHYVIEGDGMAEIIYVNPNKVPPDEVRPAITTGSDATIEMNYASKVNAEINPQIVSYSMWGWVFAMKNLRLVNLTPQWFMITGFPFYKHSTMFYFDSVEFFADFWFNQTTMVVMSNCYVNGAKVVFDTTSREVMVIGCRFDRKALLAITPRGWTVVGCVFVGTNVTALNLDNDGNNGIVIGCIFDGTTIVAIDAFSLRIVASTFENLTIPSQGSIRLARGTDYMIVACSFNNYNVTMEDLKLGDRVTVAFSTFTSSNLVLLVEDGQNVNMITIIGNVFVDSPIFISGSSTTGNSLKLSGTINVIYISFNTFIMNNESNWNLGNGYVIEGNSPINIALTVNYVYVVMNNFLGTVKNSFSLQQLNNNVTIGKYFFYYNVNLGNILVPMNQNVVIGMNF